MRLGRLGVAALTVAVMAVPAAAQAGDSGIVVSAQPQPGNPVGYVYFGPANLWRLDVAGTAPQRLTDTPLWDSDPTMAPDDTLYFARYSGGYAWVYPAGFAPINGQSDLWRMKLDGSGLEPVTRTPHKDEWNPAFSADGRYLAYERWDAVTYATGDVVVLDLETGTEKVISPPAADWYLGSPSFTPDGERVVFVQEKEKLHQIASAKRDGSDPRVLYTAKAGAHEATVSPDGTRIVFTRYDDPESNKQVIAVMDSDGTNERALTSGRALDWAPSWSPDATAVLYTHNDLRGNSRLFRVSADGSKAQRHGNLQPWALNSVWFGPRPAVFPPPPSFAAPVTTPPTPAPAAARPASPLRVKTRSVRVRRGHASLRVSCAGKAACRGRVVLVVQSGGPPRALGSAKVAVGAGRRADVRIRLTSAARRMVRGRGTVTARADYLSGRGQHHAGVVRLRAR